ncbi:MAG: 50S ribosomal protein L35 [Armatimonadetes bacterium]|nr:50S ribosomal protein L35 [Armatimonadota bacterium]
MAEKKTKLKTSKTAAKRFDVTARGKIRRGCTGLNHLMRRKSPSRQRRLLSGDELDHGDRTRIRRMLGNGH